METVNPMDKIQAKLRKLMSLYEGAKEINSEGEANAAAAAIQRLLTQYNLSMEDISSEEKKDEIKEEEMSSYRYKSIGGNWEFHLMYVICKWNFCKCFGYGKKNMIFFGKEENILTVKWMHNMLCEKFVAFGKDRYKQYQSTSEYARKPIGLDTYLRRYLMGCCAGLDTKFKGESDAAKSEDESYGAKVTALVVRNTTAVDEYVEGKFGKTRNSRKTNVKADSCYAFGYKDGKNTSINKQVSESHHAQASKVKLIG